MSASAGVAAALLGVDDYEHGRQDRERGGRGKDVGWEGTAALARAAGAGRRRGVGDQVAGGVGRISATTRRMSSTRYGLATTACTRVFCAWDGSI